MRPIRVPLLVLGLLLLCLVELSAEHTLPPGTGTSLPWWGWALILFVFTFFLGILAVVAGVGGGVLFVPIVSSLFPFHLDFIRGAGLMVALTGALSASPRLLKSGLASMRMALPMALIGSICSIAGAGVGLALPTSIVEASLGISIIAIVILMVTAKRADFPEVSRPDPLSTALGIYGVYREESQNEDIAWQIHRTPVGMLFFILIGFTGGVFGLGAGWANVPVFNLLLGAPLKIAVGTSIFFISINSSAAAWVYLNNGAVLPLITVPSVAGMMLGTRIGAKLLSRTRPRVVKILVVTFLLAAGIRSLLKGIGIWE